MACHSVTWSNIKDLSNCWSNGEKLITFNTGNAKGTDHSTIGIVGTVSDLAHLIGCIGEIIGFYRSLTDTETSYIHQYLMKKWGITESLSSFKFLRYREFPNCLVMTQSGKSGQL